MFADLKTIVPTVMYIVAPCVPQTLLKYVLNPQIFCPHSADTTYNLTADNPWCQCLRFTAPTPDLTTCTSETDITPNSQPAPHCETRHPGFDHHECLA